MKRRFIAISFAAALLAISTFGQGTFQNLGFESARVVLLPDGKIAVTNALPGWSAFDGTNELSEIDYNALPGPGAVQLLSSNYYPVINGGFEVALALSAGIRQTGLVPADAQSLRFQTRFPTSGMLSVDAQSLSYTLLSSGSGFNLYGADVSAFAGQTATFTFVGSGFLDDIQFSSQPIPEPSFSSLLSLIGLFFAVHKFRWQRST